jgi:hypothetical protein
MLVRYDEQGLYIGVCGVHSAAEPCVTLTVQDSYDIPVTDSPRWFVRIAKGVIAETSFTARGQVLPWECRWRAATAQADGRIEAEVLIPFENRGQNSVSPKPGDRWRINCAIADASVPDSPSLIRWGSEDVAQVELGVIVVFGDADLLGKTR